MLRDPLTIEDNRPQHTWASDPEADPGPGRKFYLESYGCQMNFNDSEIVASILESAGWVGTSDHEKADLILINTCSIRDKAEQTIRKRLTEFRKAKTQRPDILIGILGCMAERLKSKLLEEERLVDLVVGPDAYRSLPRLVKEAVSGHKGVQVLLSREETYGDISPVRLNSNGVTAFVSIMRGCDNMCSFCVVPYTRGRERSRDPRSILREVTDLSGSGYREVTLLGQNVDSYRWTDPSGAVTDFADLLGLVAAIDPLLRVRFSTSHPKDITDKVLHAMAGFPNICKHIHLPLQSGSSRILELMNRGYSRDWYLEKVERIREILPGCALSTDLITGFCTETESDHMQTLEVMELCKYDLAYMFMYSERPGTPASRRLTDDISREMKQKRLQEIVTLHRDHALESMRRNLGKSLRVLVEGPSKRNEDEFCGRTDANRMVVFPADGTRQGQYVTVRIESCTSATLKGRLIEETSLAQ
ncbi:MAG TPA: tRNA (N6-isopentenyl adenosine(37)-C2)-methylthiotransferase MiaB [Chitinophagaceae bacterium]|nr:tRNA (N6-isopentenyl adenosine(37)-C2)-methylthiotransferase MiaB [Chitinophagaceae bacterium]